MYSNKLENILEIVISLDTNYLPKYNQEDIKKFKQIYDKQ